MDRSTIQSFFQGLESLCQLPKATQIMEVVKLSCPIEKYAEVEQFLNAKLFVCFLCSNVRKSDSGEERQAYETVWAASQHEA